MTDKQIANLNPGFRAGQWLRRNRSTWTDAVASRYFFLIGRLPGGRTLSRILRRLTDRQFRRAIREIPYTLLRYQHAVRRMTDRQFAKIAKRCSNAVHASSECCRRMTDAQFDYATFACGYEYFALEFPWACRRLTDEQFGSMVQTACWADVWKSKPHVVQRAKRLKVKIRK